MASECFLTSPQHPFRTIIDEFIEFIKSVESFCGNPSFVEFVNDYEIEDKVSERGLLEVKFEDEISEYGTLYMEDQEVNVVVSYRQKVEFEKTHITKQILNKLDILIGFITGDRGRIPDNIYFDGVNYFDGAWYFAAQDGTVSQVSSVRYTGTTNQSSKENKLAHYEMRFNIKKR